MTTNKKIKSKIFHKLIIAIAFILSASTMFGLFMYAPSAYAYSQKDTTLSNLNFSANGNRDNVYSNPTGWTKGKESTATSGAINLDRHNESFFIDANQIPRKLSDSSDDHVLMINSKSKDSNIPCVQYYTNTSALTLSPYSNYKIVVWTQVLEGAVSSVYLSGLDERIGFEKIDYSIASEWASCTFYISTGMDAEEIKTELWLGASPNKTSQGAVFFDNIEVFQLSNDQMPETETTAEKYISEPQANSDCVKYINLNTAKSPIEFDGTFESGMDGWTYASSQMQVGTYAEVINQSNNSTSIAKGIEYLGTDLTKGNKKALVLYTDSDVKSYFGVKSPSIKLPMYETYKISVNVKSSDLDGGSAYIKFIEGNILDHNQNKIEDIAPVTKEISITSNKTNSFTNNYTTCSFYVKGRSLYATSFNLELWLGSSSNKTSGAVAFDNITIEQISDSDYTKASTDSYSQKFELQPNDGDYGITNATFNTVEKENREMSYPLIPSNWTQESSDKNDAIFGVVNTYKPVYEQYSETFEGISNPGNPEGFLSTDIDTNNILLMHNINNAYQTVKSSKFNVSANKYYKLTFDYKLIATGADGNNELLNVYVNDEKSAVLYADENIVDTNFTWKKYTIHISTNSYTNELRLILNLGTEDSLVKGIAYIDNVRIYEDTSMTKETYEEITKTENFLDFQEGNFNLFKDNGTSVHTPLRYTGKLEQGEQPSAGSAIASGGIIDGNNENDEFIVENSPNNNHSLKYMMMIQTHGEATYSFTANDSLSLETDSYYKFSIDAKTMFDAAASSETETYGAEFGLTGINEKIDGIVAEDWTTYTIYVRCTETTTVNLRFALNSLNLTTAGTVFFDNHTFEKIDADIYNVAELNNKNDSTFLFVGETTIEEDKDTSSSVDTTSIWFIIPSLILAVAIVLALVVYLMKKVKIKKWERRKVNEYDREKTIARDVIRMDAEKARDNNIKAVKAEIAEIQQRITELDENHQARLKERRNSHIGVTKGAENEFKQYAKLHTALENRIQLLNKEIDNMNTPEYLLSVQHKLAIEKAKQERLNREMSFNKNKKRK